MLNELAAWFSGAGDMYALPTQAIIGGRTALAERRSPGASPSHCQLRDSRAGQIATFLEHRPNELLTSHRPRRRN